MTFYQYVAKSGLINDTFYGDYYSFISDKFKESIFEKHKNKKGVTDYKSLVKYFILEQKKRVRTYTNALVKIGLVYEKRKITAVGESLLDGDTKQDDIEKMNILKNLNKSMIKLVLS